MMRRDDGRAAAVQMAVDQRLQSTAGVAIKRGEWFIQQPQRALEEGQTGQRQALFLAGGELLDQAVGEVFGGE